MEEDLQQTNLLRLKSPRVVLSFERLAEEKFLYIACAFGGEAKKSNVGVE